jgi:hypothetical protein
LQDDVVTNAMRAIQGTIRGEFAWAVVDAQVEELLKSEFGVVYDFLQARSEQDSYLLTQGTGAADALLKASLRTIFTGAVVDQVSHLCIYLHNTPGYQSKMGTFMYNNNNNNNNLWYAPGELQMESETEGCLYPCGAAII